MSMTHFTTTITVDQSPQEVFDAINNVRGWWQGTIEGDTIKQGDEFDYRMKDLHYSRQRVLESVPGERLVWLVTDSKLPSFDNDNEWTGTKIIFEITEEAGQTQLRFTHEGLTPSFACYGACSGAWGALVRESLYSLISTGKGRNVFG
ncbi:SRPBCC domain-containing protein [Rurimicrobium arvi]|uniref:Activator of Hsp90 ATPase homologue 1/2-like C-terminal domain-containing protein n=1 Tax=Rurimicrobium arvi TaxID=2049916 RepID=A0ABP8N095_9BACT